MNAKIIDDLMSEVQRLLVQVESLKKDSCNCIDDEVNAVKIENNLSQTDSVRLDKLLVDFRYLCEHEHIDSRRIEYDLNTMCIKCYDTLLNFSDLQKLHFSFVHPGDNACLFLNY